VYPQIRVHRGCYKAEEDAKRLTNASPLINPQHSTGPCQYHYVRAPATRTHASRTTHTVIHWSHMGKLGISADSQA